MNKTESDPECRQVYRVNYYVTWKSLNKFSCDKSSRQEIYLKLLLQTMYNQERNSRTQTPKSTNRQRNIDLIIHHAYHTKYTDLFKCFCENWVFQVPVLIISKFRTLTAQAAINVGTFINELFLVASSVALSSHIY